MKLFKSVSQTVSLSYREAREKSKEKKKSHGVDYRVMLMWCIRNRLRQRLRHCGLQSLYTLMKFGRPATTGKAEDTSFFLSDSHRFLTF